MPAFASDLAPDTLVIHDKTLRVGRVSEIKPMKYDGTTYFWVWWNVPRGKSGTWNHYKEISIMEPDHE